MSEDIEIKGKAKNIFLIKTLKGHHCIDENKKNRK